METHTETSNPIRCPQIVVQGPDPVKFQKAMRKNKTTPTEYPDYDRFPENSNFSEKHDNIQDRVKSILMFDKFSRKNDLWLLLIYYQKMGWITMKVDINQFNSVSPPESISRARRRLYEEIRQGKHLELKKLIDKDTEFCRKEEEENYHNYFQDKKLSYELMEEAKNVK